MKNLRRHQNNLKNCKLTLIGEVEKGLEHILKPLLNEKINIIKPVSQNLLRTFYNQASVFITCSIEDGFGMVLLQAMACGLPVIASKTGYFEEFLNVSNEENACGKIVSIEDYKTASKEIVALLSDQELFSKFSKNAIDQSKQKYNVLEEANAINKVYEYLWNS